MDNEGGPGNPVKEMPVAHLLVNSIGPGSVCEHKKSFKTVMVCFY